MNKIWSIIKYKGNSIACAVLTAMFTLIPEDVFKFGLFQCNWPETSCIIVNRLIACVVVFIVVDVLYCWHRRKRTSVTISERTFSIKIEYGDLLEVKNGKKVIDFDECFTTKVGEKTEEIKPGSLCGQYLMQKPIDDMAALIAASGAKPTGTSQCKQQPAFMPGTIVPRGNDLLMAFTELNVDGRGVMTYDKYVRCLDLLWQEIDKYHGTDDVYLPVIGSRITRFDRDLTQQELLDIIIDSYRLSQHKLKLPNELHIVCREREGFSLNNVFGVD